MEWESSQIIESTQNRLSSLSQRALSELCELAEATEDFDAILNSSITPSISSFLNASQV